MKGGFYTISQSATVGTVGTVGTFLGYPSFQFYLPPSVPIQIIWEAIGDGIYVKII